MCMCFSHIPYSVTRVSDDLVKVLCVYFSVACHNPWLAYLMVLSRFLYLCVWCFCHIPNSMTSMPKCFGWVLYACVCVCLCGIHGTATTTSVSDDLVSVLCISVHVCFYLMVLSLLSAYAVCCRAAAASTILLTSIPALLFRNRHTMHGR